MKNQFLNPVVASWGRGSGTWNGERGTWQRMSGFK